MDFFSYQEAARKKTGLILFYFAAAVVLIVIAVYLAVSAALSLGAMDGGPRRGPPLVFDPRLFPWVAGGTLGLITLGSLYRIAQLRSGGAAVAQMLGGRLVNPDTQDLDERVLLNVVEEMAVASGVPVPPVYLLEREKGINAFAAGFTPNDAVVGVTRGAIETLSRDELQGVIAHEFSHILNGDMRLNVRLIGVLHGILLLAIVGMQLIRSAPHSSRRDGKGGGAMAVLMLVGVGLAVIGSVGVFFGRLIKAAVSRQREFLADASAVQFTRNPPGLAGALKKIGGWSAGARVTNAKAEEASHMFFGNALRGSLAAWTSTHPPLLARIKRIEPSFDGTYPEVARLARSVGELQPLEAAEGLQRQAAAIRSRRETAAGAGIGATAFGFQPETAVASVGAPATEHVDYAAALIAAVPEALREGVRDPLGALAAVLGLLLSADPKVRRAQTDDLARHAGQHVLRELERLQPLVDSLAAETRLPLVESVLPALQRLSPAQYQGFRESVRRLVEADAQISLFEYALQRVLLENLAPRFERRPPRRVRFRDLPPLLPACSQLLSLLAYAGEREEGSAQSAFAQGAAALDRDGRRPELLARDDFAVAQVDEALERLAEAAPLLKRDVLDACARCIGADGKITVPEAELLRVIALSLDCPMPPLAAAFAALREPMRCA